MNDPNRPLAPIRLEELLATAEAARAFAGSIVDTMRESLLVLDCQLRVVAANRTFHETFRVSPEETVGRLVYELGNGQWDIPRLRTLLEEIRPENGAFRDYEVEHVFEHIGRKIMLLNGRRLRREAGLEAMIFLAIEDVTERRQAEEARQKAESRFTEMVKNVQDHSIFLTDPEGVITSWNVAAERIIGYTAEEAVGRHFSMIFTPEDLQDGLPEQELQLAREQGRAEDERWHLRKNGDRFWALGIVTPIYETKGALSGFSKILRDFTERKQAEAALHESEERLRRLNAELDHRVRERTEELRQSEEHAVAMAALAEQRSAQLRVLAEELTRAEQRERRRVAEILHEHIQQLLVAANMHVDMVRSHMADERPRELLKHAQSILEEATSACRSLAVDLSPPVLYVQGLVAAVEWLAEQMSSLHRLAVEVSADRAAEPRGSEVRELLFQAVRELLLNVVKHAETDRAWVRIARHGSQEIQLEVRDRGKGFAHPKGEPLPVTNKSWGIFHMSERLEQFGGSLFLESEPGGGTCARIVVPQADGGEQESPTAGPPSHDKQALPAGAGAKKDAIQIVLLDDHKTVSNALAALIEREPDLEVIGEAGEGRIGLDVVRDLEPDVVIMDVKLPDMTGIEATREIKRMLPHVQVIGLSMDNSDQTAAEMHSAGATAYLAKDAPVADLIAAIRRAGGRR